MSELCPKCGGLGLLKTETGSRACSCQMERQAAGRVNRIGIPPTFAQATLDSYIAGPQAIQALTWARRYVDEFIPGQTRTGLLFVGPVGVGKTHLAVGMLKELAAKKGVEARMVDLRDLFDRLRSSYDDRNISQESQAQILRPFFSADLVLIDELGAATFTDWVLETLELLIGRLYNQAKPVLVTTNMPNFGPGEAIEEVPTGNYAVARAQAQRAAKLPTLGDRIGMRMWSRLQQMCRPIEVSGQDWRRRVS